MLGFIANVKKTDLAIVNRSFWPQGQVIGEGLLQFSEVAAEDESVCVITQAEDDLEQQLKASNRGHGVKIRACKSYTSSGSGVFKRIGEALFFMLWTFISLVRAKPKNVYVSTNPPVVVPFIVALYCRLFKADYVYHLQDIHPEAADIIVPLNTHLYNFLKRIDNYTLRHAKAIITLSEGMKNYLQLRDDLDTPIFLLDNPAYDLATQPLKNRTMDVVFCGNAGRLQRIPLLMTAIREYIHKGGNLNFTFAGSGVYAEDIYDLANSFDQVFYLGVISALEASELVSKHRWALLPIDDEVTKFAFPSKSSGYALSGTGILGICGGETSVAKWIIEHAIGVVCEPDHNTLVDCFFSLERELNNSNFTISQDLRDSLQLKHFAQKLYELSISKIEMKG